MERIEMKPEMKDGRWYIVTKRSKNGTFRVGDHISLNTDGSINCREVQGWVDAWDVPQAMVGVEYVVDTKWLEKRKAKLQKELDRLSSED